MDDIVARLRFVAQIHEGRVKHECIAEAADEIERLQAIIRNLRTLGDRLCVHLDAQFGIANPAPYEIDKSIFLWREFRHDS